MASSIPTSRWLPDLRDTRMRVLISAAAVASIRAEIESRSDGRETGGILLGQMDPLRVITAGGPGPGAVRTKSFFLRDLQYSQELAAREAAYSGAQWVGEWHTHPTGPPHPSSTDLQTYERLQNELGSVLADGVLSLIVTTDNVGWFMTAWWCIDGRGEQIPMEER